MMKFRLMRALAALALVGGVGAGPVVAQAETFPDRPVTLVLGFAPGGPADTATRMIADGLSRKLGQPVIVRNDPGATGVIAANNVARAAPDGYTLLVATQSTLAIAPNTLTNLTFDPLKSFAPVSTTITSPWVLMVNPSLPVKSVADLVALARKSPGELNYASVGRGGSHNFVSELFKRAAGNIDIKHVPFKGSSEAYLALARGDIQMMFDTLPSPLPMIADGKFRALAVTGPQRLEVLPQVPTFAEQGMGKLDATSWFGIAAPAKTPAPVLARLNRDLLATMADPAFQQSVKKMGLSTSPSSEQEFARFLVSEHARWKDIVESIDFRKE